MIFSSAKLPFATEYCLQSLGLCFGLWTTGGSYLWSPCFCTASFTIAMSELEAVVGHLRLFDTIRLQCWPGARLGTVGRVQLAVCVFQDPRAALHGWADQGGGPWCWGAVPGVLQAWDRWAYSRLRSGGQSYRKQQLMGIFSKDPVVTLGQVVWIPQSKIAAGSCWSQHLIKTQAAGVWVRLWIKAHLLDGQADGCAF